MLRPVIRSFSSFSLVDKLKVIQNLFLKTSFKDTVGDFLNKLEKDEEYVLVGDLQTSTQTEDIFGSSVFKETLKTTTKMVNKGLIETDILPKLEEGDSFYNILYCLFPSVIKTVLYYAKQNDIKTKNRQLIKDVLEKLNTEYNIDFSKLEAGIVELFFSIKMESGWFLTNALVSDCYKLCSKISLKCKCNFCFSKPVDSKELTEFAISMGNLLLTQKKECQQICPIYISLYSKWKMLIEKFYPLSYDSLCSDFKVILLDTMHVFFKLWSKVVYNLPLDNLFSQSNYKNQIPGSLYIGLLYSATILKQDINIISISENNNLKILAETPEKFTPYILIKIMTLSPLGLTTRPQLDLYENNKKKCQNINLLMLDQKNFFGVINENTTRVDQVKIIPTSSLQLQTVPKLINGIIAKQEFKWRWLNLTKESDQNEIEFFINENLDLLTYTNCWLLNNRKNFTFFGSFLQYSNVKYKTKNEEKSLRIMTLDFKTKFTEAICYQQEQTDDIVFIIGNWPQTYHKLNKFKTLSTAKNNSSWTFLCYADDKRTEVMSITDQRYEIPVKNPKKLILENSLSRKLIGVWNSNDTENFIIHTNQLLESSRILLVISDKDSTTLNLEEIENTLAAYI